MRPEMKEEEEKEGACRTLQFEEALELINGLISSSYSVILFPVKWQLIRSKLEQLQSGLTAATRCNSSAANSVLSELLQAIKSMAKDTEMLVRLCSNESYCGGKLQLRSDLDIVASKLELYIKKINEIFASGVLIHGQAIIVSRPAFGASREDMRFYMRNLFARLKIGDLEMRIQALACLNEILHEDEKYLSILVAEVTDGVNSLVSLLDCRDASVQEEASEAVSVIAGFDSYRGALARAGAIAPLIRVLETGRHVAKERAGRALKKLTENSENAWSISAQGGVSMLLKICSHTNSSEELIRSACSILKSLSCIEEIKKFMVEERAISIFVKLSRSKEESSQIQAMEFLSVLACDDDALKNMVVKEGLLGSLFQVLDPNSKHSSKAREVALRAIDNLSFSSPTSVNFLMTSGFLDRVLFFLRNGEISIQESALKAVSRLCALSEMTKKAMGDAGFMPELMKLLEAKPFQVREMAAEALSNMISVHRNRKRFIQEDHNVNQILQLLDPEDEKSATKKFLLSALMSLTDSNSARRKIISSGYVKNLEKLAETDAKDAKKIVKKLFSNRFRNLLTGIWSL